MPASDARQRPVLAVIPARNEEENILPLFPALALLMGNRISTVLDGDFKPLTVPAYLSGGMEYAAGEGIHWRRDLQEWLEQSLRHEVFNPNVESDRFFSTHHPGINFRTLKNEDVPLYQQIAGRLVEIDCREIAERSDYIICFWDEGAAKGAGTKGELKVLELLGDENDPSSAFVTIHSGAGGTCQVAAAAADAPAAARRDPQRVLRRVGDCAPTTRRHRGGDPSPRPAVRSVGFSPLGHHNDERHRRGHASESAH